MANLQNYLKEIKEREAKATCEEWSTILEASHYQVSNMGRVRSLLKPGNHKNKLGKQYKELSQFVDKRGYCSVNLKNDNTNKYKRYLVHRLVASYFCNGKLKPSLHVAHLDRNPSNNKASNLLICNAKENNSHKKIHGTSASGEKNGTSKLMEWQIDEIRFLAEKSIPQSKIAVLFNISKDVISTIVNDKSWSHVTTRQDIPRLLEMVEVMREKLEKIIEVSGTSCEHYHLAKEAIEKCEELAGE